MKNILILSFCLLALFACNRAESAIDSLRDLVEDVKENGQNFTEDDWQSFAEEYQSLADEMSEMEFTSEQEKEIGRLHAQLLVYAGRHYSGYMQEQMSEFGKAIGNVMQGFSDGFDEALMDE